MRRIIEEYQPRSEELIESLTSEYQWLPLLKGQGKKYEPILDYLYSIGAEDDKDPDNFDYKKAQSTKIAKATGINMASIKRYLSLIYNDLLTLNYEQPSLFDNGNPHQYRLSFRYDNYQYRNFNIWLSNELNLFDRFYFNFIKGKVNYMYFCVDNIYYIHKHGKSVREVSMSSGNSNLYRKLLLDKALFMHEIYDYEEYNLRRSEIDEKLRKYGRREKL